MGNNWPMVLLANVIREEREPIGTVDGDGLPVYGVTNIEGVTQTGIKASEDRSKYLRLRPGRFVYNPYRVNVGSLGLSSQAQDGIVSPAYIVFVPSEKIDTRFLNYFLKSARGNQLINFYGNRGSVRSALRFTDLCKIEIPLPRTLEEQQRVVARIDELTKQMNEAKIVRQQALEGVEALVLSISARLFKLKPGWQIKPVEQFCEPPQYGYTESATEEPIGPRFLRITDIQNGKVDWVRVPYCRCDNPSKYLLKPNDLVFARTGATTGKSFVIRDCPTAVFASYLIRLRVKQGVSVDYLYHYFQSPGYWAQITDEKKGTGQPNLNGSRLRKIKVPVPPPDVQHQIVTKLNVLHTEVDTLKRLQAETAVELDALFPSILDKAFKGEL